ncbi:MAG: phosphoribosylglycinamide formyltransferase, partial [Elusimicrobiota bacterium]|nr:phosphoribosylglycinamide formyltransferase [Elusimicrobiota bacterium]
MSTSNFILKIGVLVSGSGTNLQAIIDACQSGYLPAKVVVVISNRKDAYALERAKRHNIEALFIDRKLYQNEISYSAKLVEELKMRQVDLVCLAGFLLKLGPNFIEQFRNRILNIHPALLPKFGGKGMYGHHVHEAVLKSGEKVSGCTVHFV